MEKLTEKAEAILPERFSKDSIIALATTVDNVPYVRAVDAFYENGVFYVLTYLRFIGQNEADRKNPVVGVSGEWFTAHGKGVNLGWFGSDENKVTAEKMRTVFADWIGNGHNNSDDRNTIILRIELTDGFLFSRGTRNDIDFSNLRGVYDE